MLPAFYLITENDLTPVVYIINKLSTADPYHLADGLERIQTYHD